MRKSSTLKSGSEVDSSKALNLPVAADPVSTKDISVIVQSKGKQTVEETKVHRPKSTQGGGSSDKQRQQPPHLTHSDEQLRSESDKKDENQEVSYASTLQQVDQHKYLEDKQLNSGRFMGLCWSILKSRD